MRDYTQDDLRGEPARQAEEEAAKAKCGTCRFCSVKPNEAGLAQAAGRACGPAQYCFGGPVRGTCLLDGTTKWSTDVCQEWQEGGPNYPEEAGVVGTANRSVRYCLEFNLSESVAAKVGVVGILAGTVAVLGAAYAVDRRRNRS